ncbi:MAG TPA: M1 family aminopeptidase [Acidimicrobiales bacterium]|nr:M1 family aminopeptidase [Acidimicrobiales bacterium]
MTRRLVPTALLLALALAACSTGDRASFSRSPTTVASPDAPAVTTTTALATATTPACPAIPSRVAPDPARPKYTLRVDVRPVDGTVDGDLRVVFTPDVDTDRLVFRLWPNGPRSAPAAARLEPGQVTVGGRVASSTMDDATTLVVRTGTTFRARQPVDVAMPWQLRVPGAANDRISRNGDAMRLGSFFPILPWEPGVGWATDPAVGGFAEASTAPTADFDLTVTVPEGFNVLASGMPDPARPGHYTASAMRDVALSVGRFETVSAVAMAPERVQVTVGVHRGVTDPANVYLDRVVASLQDFGRRFGPYPWPTFTMAITPELGGGIEYPAHVMQGPGTIGVASHEVGHQWFYALVGNNQGRDPWLDEGLASWAEARFEGRLERFKARVIPDVARNKVGEPMTYWADKRQVYSDGVYVQGAQALAALGDADLVDCALRVFVAVNAYRVARQADLVKAASAVFPNAASTLAAYGVKA